MSQYAVVIKSLLEKTGEQPSEYRIEKTLGFASDVIFLEVEKRSFVLKIFKDTSLEGSPVYYGKDRALLEVECYQRINRNYIPRLISYSIKDHSILLEKIQNYHLLTDSILERRTIPNEFFDEMIGFFKYKRSTFIKLKNSLYSYKDARFLKGLYISAEYDDQLNRLFEKGKGSLQCVNHAGLSPKNIFHNDLGQIKIIDFEDSFVGDYVYDPAFFVGHILIYGIITENTELLMQGLLFLNRIRESYIINPSDYERVLGYAGMMFLHRAKGFNLSGTFFDSTSLLNEIGHELLINRSLDKLNKFIELHNEKCVE